MGPRFQLLVSDCTLYSTSEMPVSRLKRFFKVPTVEKNNKK